MLSFVLLFALVFSALLSWFYISNIITIAYTKELFDLPNDRKVHHTSIPRLGGVAFLPALFISSFVSLAISYRLGFQMLSTPVILDFCSLVTGLTVLYFTGIFDDLTDLKYATKFAMQFIVACLFPLSGLWINNLYGLLGLYAISPLLGMPLTIVLVIFIINAFNLIDGIDGLASGLSIVALSVLGLLLYEKGLWLYSVVAISMVGLLITFFSYNVFGSVERRQKIFMGDTGSLILGYILAFLAIRYISVNPVLISFTKGAIMIAFSPLVLPMVDVLQVMYIRWRRGQGFFTPDRTSHIHHRLMNMGLTPRQAMVSIILLSSTFVLTNILLAPCLNINILFLGNILLWVVFNVASIRVNERHNKRLIARATHY